MFDQICQSFLRDMRFRCIGGYSFSGCDKRGVFRCHDLCFKIMPKLWPYHRFHSYMHADFMESNGIRAEVLHWPLEGREPNTIRYLAEGKIDLVINIPKNIEKSELDNDYLIRRKAVDFNVPLITNLQLAKRFADAIYRMSLEDLKIKRWEEYN